MTIRTGTAEFYIDGDPRWVAEDTETDAFFAFGNAYERDRFVRDHNTFTYRTDNQGYGVMGTGARLYKNILWDEPKSEHRIIWHTAWDGKKYYAKYEPLTGRRTGDKTTVEQAQAVNQFVIEVTVGGNSDWQYYEEKEEAPVTDYEKRYYDLLDALDAEAKRREWCSEYDEFKKKNNVTDDRKPKYPFPTKGGAVIKAAGYTWMRDNHNRWRAHADRSTTRTDEELKDYLERNGDHGAFEVILEGA
jgi:hypothetical protein